MNKLPHEIQEMCDDAEAVADFLIGWPAGTVIATEDGNVWPLNRERLEKWEQSIRSLKQMVMNSK